MEICCCFAMVSLASMVVYPSMHFRILIYQQYSWFMIPKASFSHTLNVQPFKQTRSTFSTFFADFSSTSQSLLILTPYKNHTLHFAVF